MPSAMSAALNGFAAGCASGPRKWSPRIASAASFAGHRAFRLAPRRAGGRAIGIDVVLLEHGAGGGAADAIHDTGSKRSHFIQRRS
jgi:hypothetical protein